VVTRAAKIATRSVAPRASNADADTDVRLSPEVERIIAARWVRLNRLALIKARAKALALAKKRRRIVSVLVD
jgi:hypothetical protein